MTTQTDIITTLLEKLDPTLEKMADRIFIDENNALLEKGYPARVQTEYNKEWTKLMLMRDITKSLSNYTKPTDILCDDFHINGSKKGTLMITTNIMRDGVKYYLSTSVIYAGGHRGGVQCLHYRMLTNSTLPKDGDKTKLNEILEKIKKLTKTQKIHEEIKRLEGHLVKFENEYLYKTSLSDEEILKTSRSYEYLVMTHDQINRDSHAWETWKDNQKGFEEHQESERKNFILDFKRRTEVIKNHNIKVMKKDIEKQFKKLEQ